MMMMHHCVWIIGNNIQIISSNIQIISSNMQIISSNIQIISSNILTHAMPGWLRVRVRLKTIFYKYIERECVHAGALRPAAGGARPPRPQGLGARTAGGRKGRVRGQETEGVIIYIIRIYI